MATKTQTQHRSAVDGKFVTEKFAKAHTRETVTERNKVSHSAPSKKK